MKHIEGDLLLLAEQGKFDVIIHGCNCQCVMGSGIAKQIADAYPPVLEKDLETGKGERLKLGFYSLIMVQSRIPPHCFIVINAYTQFRYGRGVQVNYQAIWMAMKSISERLTNDVRIGIPLIGAGRGGGDWDVIAPIIDRFFQDKDLTLVTLPKETSNG